MTLYAIDRQSLTQAIVIAGAYKKNTKRERQFRAMLLAAEWIPSTGISETDMMRVINSSMDIANSRAIKRTQEQYNSSRLERYLTKHQFVKKV